MFNNLIQTSHMGETKIRGVFFNQFKSKSSKTPNIGLGKERERLGVWGGVGRWEGVGGTFVS